VYTIYDALADVIPKHMPGKGEDLYNITPKNVETYRAEVGEPDPTQRGRDVALWLLRKNAQTLREQKRSVSLNTLALTYLAGPNPTESAVRRWRGIASAISRDAEMLLATKARTLTVPGIPRKKQGLGLGPFIVGGAVAIGAGILAILFGKKRKR
jgi:hypothetical protein